MEPRDLRDQQLPEVPSYVFPIPPVYDRPLGVEEGERIFVSAFRITGITDDPRSGISSAEINELTNQRFQEVMALAEAERQEAQDLDIVDQHGFTDAERARMSEVMNQLVNTFDPIAQQQAVDALLNELRLARFERDAGLTIGQLQVVADRITTYFRERGFFLARAILPAQEVVDGVVEIRVLEGRLGRAIAEGNSDYPTEVIIEPFRELEGELINQDSIVGPLLRVNDYPGLTVAGVFQPGEEVGTADIVLSAVEEQAFGFSVRGDNHLSPFQGDFRLLANFDWNNPTGNADQFTLSLLHSQRPDDTLYWGVHYGRPFFNPRWSFSLDASRNTFDVGGLLSSFDIGGESEIATLGFGYSMRRTRLSNVNLFADVNARRASILQFGDVTNVDKLSNIGFGFSWDNINQSNQSISSGFLRFDHGTPNLFGAWGRTAATAALNDPTVPGPSRSAQIDGVTVPASSRFEKLSFNYQRLKIINTESGNQSFFFQVDGQYSPDLLTSLDQYSIGGPYNLRAIPTSTFLTDSGITGTLEWTIRAPGFADAPALPGRTWGQIFSITFFYDRTMGWTNFSLANEFGRLSLGGGGVGFGLDFGDLSFRAQWARLYVGNGLLATIGDPDGQGEGETQLWIDMSYDIR